MPSHGGNCCVDGCKFKTRDNVSFFRCPKDPIRCQQWKDNLGFVGEHKYAKLTCEESYARIKICAAHFDDKSFTSSGKRLLNTAIPSKILPKFEDYNKQNDEFSGPSIIQIPVNLEEFAQTDIEQKFASDYNKQNDEISGPSIIQTPVNLEEFAQTDIEQKFPSDYNKQKDEISGPSIVQIPVKLKEFAQTDIKQKFTSGETQTKSAKLGPLEEIYCAVLECSNTFLNCRLNFFGFPIDSERAKAWVLACDRVELLQDLSNLHKTHTICAAHFDVSSFIIDKCTLRPNAVPTIFNNPSTVRVTECLTCDIPEYVSVEPVTDDEIKLEIDAHELDVECKSESFQDEGSVLLKAVKNNLEKEHVPSELDPLSLNTVEIKDKDDSDVKLITASNFNVINYDHDYRRTVLVGDENTVQNPQGMFLNVNLGQFNNINPGNIRRVIVLLDNNQQVPVTNLINNANENFVLKDLNQNTNVEMDFTNKIKQLVDTVDVAVTERPKRVRKRKTKVEINKDSEKKETEWYKCKICLKDKVYQSKATYKDHMRREHYYITCENCGESYETVKEIKNHIKDSHPEVDYRTCRPYHCDICDEEFSNRKTTIKHLKSLHNFLICGVCSMSFLSKEELLKHREIHPDKYVCEICNRGFKEKDSLYAHKECHNDPYLFVCHKCNKGCKSKSALRVHLRIHVDKKKEVMCDICSKMFLSTTDVKVHQRIVHNRLRNVQCSACDKKFRGEYDLKYHYQAVHSGEKPFQCEVCGRRFARSDYLSNHRKFHTIEHIKPDMDENVQRRRRRRRRKYDFSIDIRQHKNQSIKCTICGKNFKNFDNLKIHLNSHAGIRKYKCSFCGFMFGSSSSRNRHQKLHEQDPENKYMCRVCWKRFRTQEELDAHMGDHNKRPKKHVCLQCGEFFSRKFVLENHMALKHKTEEELNQIEAEVINKALKTWENDDENEFV